MTGSTEFQGKIELDIRDSEPDWGPFAAPTAPENSPNILYLVWDDTGIATWDCFGGLVDMPAMTRIADRGVRLSQFHTTALCSPTRASLLTGRNATTVGMATIEEFTDGFPNCNGRIPADTALLSEVLNEHGYNTYCVGKWHLTPLEECSMASTKRHWPTSRGFERFYGFMGGETDQWYPDLVYDNHPVTPPGTPEDGYHLSKDIADKTIEFIRDAKVIAPDKPWFSYVCPGAGHAPHHVFKEWADKYAGRFDMGYERYREVVLEKQKSMGIVPPDTELSPINPYLDVKGPNGEPWPLQDTVRPWDSLNDEEKKLFSRMVEVFAGFLSYTDAQIGRILDYLEESGQLDNTIIVVISDNGASGEGGPNGSVNEGKFFNGYIDTVEESMKLFDHLGGPETYNHYPIGWAMAFNTPYKLFKRYASHEGGIADTAIISWPNGIAAHGEVRDNYVNVSDITPTVYDLLGMTPPDTVKGIAQRPLDGVSFKAALEDPGADTGKTDPVLHHAGYPRDLASGLVRQHGARGHTGGLVALRQRPLGALPHRSRPQPVSRPGRRATRQARGTQGAVVLRGRQVQRSAAGRPEHLRNDRPGRGPTWSANGTATSTIPIALTSASAPPPRSRAALSLCWPT